MSFELPKLSYAYDALEPHIDARTMEIHHTKHHQAYVTNLNNAIAGTDADKLSIEEICKNISKYPIPVLWPMQSTLPLELSMNSKRNSMLPVLRDLAAVGHGLQLVLIKNL